MTDEVKTCFKCGESKPLTEFYVHGRMHGKRLNKCKECTKIDVRENYQRHREKFREYERNRATLPHRVELRKRYAQTSQGKCRTAVAKRRYMERNPIKRAAHVICGNAIQNGRLLKQPCEVCGNPKSQAHHDDYSKPLSVRWLCTTHHREWHKHNTPLCPDQENAA